MITKAFLTLFAVIFFLLVALPLYIRIKEGLLTERNVRRFNPHLNREKKAFEVLHLKPGASKADVKKAHRELMKENHPDHGGDEVRASKINEARDVLLKKAS